MPVADGFGDQQVATRGRCEASNLPSGQPPTVHEAPFLQDGQPAVELGGQRDRARGACHWP